MSTAVATTPQEGAALVLSPKASADTAVVSIENDQRSISMEHASSSASSTAEKKACAAEIASISTTDEKPDVPLTVTHILPAEKKLQYGYRQFRHVFFTVYRRLFAFVVLANLVGFLVLASVPYDLDHFLIAISSAASANLFVAILIRQDYFINLMTEVCACMPLSAPLRVRRVTAKVYEFGGIHSGCAMCAVAWFIRLAVLLTISFVNKSLRDIPTLALTYVLLVLFVGIIIFAIPGMRRKAHDAFERTHRFAGWISNLMFWTLILLTAKGLSLRETDNRSMGQVLVTLPSFYFLTINTIHTILPWLRLRRLPATPEILSSHAIRLHLKADIGPFYTIRITDRPFTEWHSFACFPDEKPVNGSTNSLVISKAGDWTSKVIANPKDTYWTRGLPTRGVLYMSLIFRKVVVVTTGSGIGPCLNLLAMDGSTRPECRVLWSTPNPLETFSEEIVNTVRKADENAVIWDTKKFGRPDMVALTWQLMMETGAEAAFVISNPKITKKVVYALESRGIAAYGPIFDS